jgi:hypothetical protein
MKRRPLIQMIVYTTILVFSGLILLDGGSLEWSYLRYASAAVFASTLSWMVWDRFLWATPLGQRLASTPPDIRGTWRGTLKSQWIDPETGSAVDLKPAYLVIRQTATTVSATLITDEQKSKSQLGEVMPGEDPELVYMYTGKPRHELQHRSRIHHGSTSLQIVGSPATRLHGHYWTDRGSQGGLDFAARAIKQYASDYLNAEAFRES